MTTDPARSYGRPTPPWWKTSPKPVRKVGPVLDTVKKEFGIGGVG
jgi:hypothetical protein